MPTYLARPSSEGAYVLKRVPGLPVIATFPALDEAIALAARLNNR